MIARMTLIAVALTALSACGGGSRTVSDAEQAMIQQGTYVYDPNKRHAPVSLSGADLIGLEPR